MKFAAEPMNDLNLESFMEQIAQDEETKNKLLDEIAIIKDKSDQVTAKL